jgi:uncharacterized membrane protein
MPNSDPRANAADGGQSAGPRPHPRGRAAAHRCQVCGNSFAGHDVLPASLVRHNIAALIAGRLPGWDPAGFICRGCLNEFRAEYVRAEMEKDRGELSALEQEVVRSLHEGALLAGNLNRQFDESLGLGERIADRVAEFGGSWRFILVFFAVMAGWITLNSLYLLLQPFDPYPFILLNLALSLLAAVQAPIILMTQNRQEARDRLRAENDYQVNLKAELEVRTVSEKLDLLIHQQWAHLLEIQQVQTEMIRDMLGRAGGGDSGNRHATDRVASGSRNTPPETPMSINKRNVDTDEIAKPSQGNAMPSGTGTHERHRHDAERAGEERQRLGVEGRKAGPAPTPAAPDDLCVRAPDEEMSADQAEHLRILCQEAGEAFDPTLTRDAAERQIERLQHRAGYKP